MRVPPDVDLSVESLRRSELELEAAQLASDVVALDRLLHPDLRFLGPDGVASDKAEDLEVHRTGVLRLDLLEPEGLEVHVDDGVGRTTLTARLAGEYRGTTFDDRMQYVREWVRHRGGWQVIAARASVLGATD